LSPLEVPLARICITYIFALETDGAVAVNVIVFASLCSSIEFIRSPTICVESSG